MRVEETEARVRGEGSSSSAAAAAAARVVAFEMKTPSRGVETRASEFSMSAVGRRDRVVQSMERWISYMVLSR